MRGGDDPTPDPDPTPELPATLSSDNVTFTNPITNYAGGDLIVDASVAGLTASETATENKIQIDTTPCTTTGAGTIGNKVGCVLPNLAEGVHTVKLSVNNGADYIPVGTIKYAKQGGNMQSYTRPADFVQGQVRILTDSRDSKPYCVKGMPDGKLWMCQNLAYMPQTGDYDETTGIDVISAGSGDSVNNKAQVITTYDALTEDMGYLYNWCAATRDTSSGCADSLAAGNTGGGTQLPATQFDNTTGILPAGWKLPTSGDDSGQFKALADVMGTAASTNPVYGSDQANFVPGSPFLGVYSGNYYNVLNDQGITGSGRYWSSTAVAGDDGGASYLLFFTFFEVDPAGCNYGKGYGFALRGVL